jgi:hypothetical protein
MEGLFVFEGSMYLAYVETRALKYNYC